MRECTNERRHSKYYLRKFADRTVSMGADMSKKTSFMLTVSACLLSLGLSGCSHFFDRAVTTRSFTNGQPKVIVTDPRYKSGVWIKDHYCETGPGDVGISAAQSYGLSMAASGADAVNAIGSGANRQNANQLSAGQQQIALALAGRSQAVLMNRDLLFSSCLIEANGFDPQSGAATRWNELKGILVDLVKASAQTGVGNGGGTTSAPDVTHDQPGAGSTTTPVRPGPPPPAPANSATPGTTPAPTAPAAATTSPAASRPPG